MRQVWIPRYGGPEVLEVRETDLPLPGPGEVTVSVKAAGVNFADLLARKGFYRDAPPLPCVVGYEVAGVVEAAGAGVEPAWIGRGVLAFTRFGGYSEKVNLPIGAVFEKPENLGFEEAAALLVNYLTAYQLVVVMGGLRKGETVLIHNAGGGVGLAALQLARHVGAVTLGTASASKHPFLKNEGLDHAIDYRTQDWEKEVRDLTGGRGVELILDPMGGPYWKKNYRLLRPTGRLGVFGASTVTESRTGRIPATLRLLTQVPLFNPLSLMDANRGVFGVNLGHLWKEAERVREWTLLILEGVRLGHLRPRVDRSFPFADAAGAHRHIEERRNTGKVLLVP
jgi:NADPH:quinone reductase-like Zn-dependent oxidoreductase